MTDLLTLENFELLTPSGKKLLGPVNITFSQKDKILLKGPNGAGKTTFMLALQNRWPFYRGRISRYFSQNETTYLPQIENIEVHIPFTLRDLLELAAPKEEIHSTLEFLGLLEIEKLNLNWNSASGGERKKTLLVKTLLKRNQSVLVLDEPTNHLDASTSKKFYSILEKDCENSLGVFLISHETQHLNLQHWKVLEFGAGK